MERKCRVCGCTQNDCRQCIEKTGEPCHWVEEDLCSACVETPSEDTEGTVQVTPSLGLTEAPLEDVYQAHVNKVLSEPKFSEMNFFKQLHMAGQGADLTIRLKEKNGQYTVMVLPQVSNQAAIKPIVLTGTPDELDAGFFTRVGPTLRETCLKVMGIEEHRKSVEEAAKASSKPAVKKEESKGKSDKPPAKKSASKKSAPAKGEKKEEKSEGASMVEETPLF